MLSSANTVSPDRGGTQPGAQESAETTIVFGALFVAEAEVTSANATPPAARTAIASTMRLAARPASVSGRGTRVLGRDITIIVTAGNHSQSAIGRIAPLLLPPCWSVVADVGDLSARVRELPCVVDRRCPVDLHGDGTVAPRRPLDWNRRWSPAPRASSKPCKRRSSRLCCRT